jgi:sulfur carrier protein ThiS adenylyltransferase
MLNLTRQSGLIPTEVIAQQTVTIVGCGAIGSHTAENLSKIGISELVLFDFDSVEEHNLPNQGFGLHELGMYKTEALKQKIEQATGVSVHSNVEAVRDDTEFTTPIVVAAVDSMAARKIIFQQAVKSEAPVLLIDGRMGGMYGQIYTVDLTDKDSIEAYDATIFDDSEGHQAPCTERATVFCAAGLASWITAVLRLHIVKESIPNLLEIDFVRMTAN